MEKTTLTSLMVIFFGFSSLCQSNYIDGYILTLESDTVWGKIKDNRESVNSKFCLFIKDEEQVPVKYFPNEIRGYRFIDSKFYISKEISIDGNPEFVFLEFLIDGIVDVFSFVNSQGTHYYIQKEGHEINKLEVNEMNINRNGKEFVIKNKTYTGYLNLLFADAPTVQNQVENVYLNRKSLVDISLIYHNQVCSDEECIVYTKNLSKVNFSIGPTVGLNKIFFAEKTLYFQYDRAWYAYFYFPAIETKPFCDNFGLMAKVTVPYTNNKIEVLYHAILYSYSFNSEYVFSKSYHYVTIYPYTIKSTDLKHNLIFHYNFLNSRLTPFVEFGGFLSQKVKQENTGFEGRIAIIDYFPKVSYFGLICGLGVTCKYYKKNEVFLSLSYNRGFGAFSYYNTNEIYVNLGFPISLTK